TAVVPSLNRGPSPSMSYRVQARSSSPSRSTSSSAETHAALNFGARPAPNDDALGKIPREGPRRGSRKLSRVGAREGEALPGPTHRDQGRARPSILPGGTTTTTTAGRIHPVGAAPDRAGADQGRLPPARPRPSS